MLLSKLHFDSKNHEKKIISKFKCRQGNRLKIRFGASSQISTTLVKNEIIPESERLFDYYIKKINFKTLKFEIFQLKKIYTLKNWALKQGKQSVKFHYPKISYKNNLSDIFCCKWR